MNSFIKISNKDSFTKSLSEYMSKFTEEFMTYCTIFIKSFQKHSQKIISEYKANETNVQIEHINFIVIGQAGIGKSSFINESLKLEGDKRAEEGLGE